MRERPAFAAQNCQSLTSINIPESVTKIDNWTFQYCYSLSSITIPESVTSIGNNAFAYCSNLTSITIEGTPVLGSFVFGGTNSNLTITVPNGDLEYIAYLNSKGIEDGKIKITNHTLEDGKDYVHSMSFESEEYSKITWKRTFAKDCWQALCLPFMLTKEEWSEVGTVAELTGASEGVLTWTPLDGPTTAGKPYIIKPKNANLDFEEIINAVRRVLFVAQGFNPGFQISEEHLLRQENSAKARVVRKLVFSLPSAGRMGKAKPLKSNRPLRKGEGEFKNKPISPGLNPALQREHPYGINKNKIYYEKDIREAGDDGCGDSDGADYRFFR